MNPSNTADRLITVVNTLQDAFQRVSSSPVDLPQIVVVGSQSSGKSSVLESLVGRDFLPRGTGIVTRRPLVLHLIHRETEQEWGEFLHHDPPRKFTNFDEIRQEIISETDRLSGTNKGISREPITLRIFSPHVLNLTLVDLPGLTRVPVGDQPPDIEAQIRDMLLYYIRKPKSIILAVTSANIDIVNSDAIQMAREVDPTGGRTVGVLTKLDLMDRGTDSVDVLCNLVVELQLGFVGVVGRSQQDINEGRTVRESLEKERQFFEAHSRYSQLTDRCGTPCLARRLNQLLLRHIRSSLPDLRASIAGLTADTRAALDACGDPVELSEAGQAQLLLGILTRFSGDFCRVVDGTAKEITDELAGGARIGYIFHEIFTRTISGMGALDGLTTDDIRTAIRNADGPRRALFVNEPAFELLVRRQIKRLLDPCTDCVTFVFNELIRIANELDGPQLRRFRILHGEVRRVVHELLRDLKRPAVEQVQRIISMELAYINTNHPDFMMGAEALSKLASDTVREMAARMSGSTVSPAGRMAPDVGRSGVAFGKSRDGNTPFISYFFGEGATEEEMEVMQAPLHSPALVPTRRLVAPRPLDMGLDGDDSEHRHGRASVKRMTEPPPVLHPSPIMPEKDRMETRLITQLLQSYFGIVKKNVLDYVPKAIMLQLVNSAKDAIHVTLVQTLYKADQFARLLGEGDEMAQQRRQCAELLGVLKHASECLAAVDSLDA